MDGKIALIHNGIIENYASIKEELVSKGYVFKSETDTEVGRVEVSHICLNDNVVEGLALKDKPAFSVQYHPEAAAGPHDAGYLFDRFTALMDKNNA